MTKIFEAIDRADHGLVWQLVQSKKDLDAIDGVTGLTPLALAAQLGRTETVRTLLEAGVDPNRGGLSTPLESAVAEGHVEVVKLLIDAKVDVNQRVAEGYTPLMTAAFLGDSEIARLLLESGAQPRARNEEGQTPIDVAEEGGFEDLARELREFSRAAFEAEQQRREEERRQREEEERQRRREERQARVRSGRSDRAESAGPARRSPSSSSSSSFAASVFAADDPEPPKGGRLPDIEEPRSPADAAAAFQALFGQLDTTPAPVDPFSLHGVERFAALVRTAPVRARRMIDFGELTGEETTSAGETPLMLAAKAGEADVVRALLNKGVEVDIQDASENGETALLKAVQTPSRGRRDVIELLLDAGADLERKHGESGRTPLMFAAQADVYNPDPHARVFADTTRHLIRLGARLDSEDAQGETLWKIIKRAALGAPTTSPFRRRLFDLLKVIETASGRAEE